MRDFAEGRLEPFITRLLIYLYLIYPMQTEIISQDAWDPS